MSSRSTESEATEPTTREDRREIYEDVLGIVDGQTSPKQAPGVRETTITRMLTEPEGFHDLEDVRTAIRAARENSDLLTWPDRDGRRRFTPAEPDKLRRVAVWEAEHEHPRTALIAWANQMVMEVTES